MWFFFIPENTKSSYSNTVSQYKIIGMHRLGLRQNEFNPVRCILVYLKIELLVYYFNLVYANDNLGIEKLQNKFFFLEFKKEKIYLSYLYIILRHCFYISQ